MSCHHYPATAVILAGGQSSRLGFDKQLLQYRGEYLIDMLLKRLAPLFQELIVVTNTPDLYTRRQCRVTADILAGHGPLGGLHAGLAAASFPVCYLTACDMPWVSAPYIRYLLEIQRQKPEIEAVVTRCGDMLEPMNAVYVRPLLHRIEGLLAEERRKMTSLLEKADVLYVAEETARRYSPDWMMFDNINTPQDWAKFEIRTQGDREHDDTDPCQTAGS